jgi:hypothetical protein
MTDQAPIVARIRKLLAMADPTRNNNEEEAATAMRMAMDLLNKHNLDLAAVQDHPSNQERVTGTAEFDVQTTASVNDQWFHVICNSLAPLYFTRAVLHTLTRRDNDADRVVRFYGKDHNVQTASLMAEYLRTSVRRLAEQAVIRQRPKASEIPLFLRSFCEGASARLHKRITDLIQERNTPTPTNTPTPSGTTNLPALVSNELALVDQFLRDNLDLRNTKARQHKTDSRAYHAGRKAADNIGLNSQVGTAKKAPCQQLAQ